MSRKLSIPPDELARQKMLLRLRRTVHDDDQPDEQLCEPSTSMSSRNDTTGLPSDNTPTDNTQPGVDVQANA